MGEKTLRSKTKFVNSYTQMMELLNDPTVEIRSMLPVGEECLQISYMPKEDDEASLVTTSLINAAFTTCYGRLHLYKYLDMVGERAIYHDTGTTFPTLLSFAKNGGCFKGHFVLLCCRFCVLPV